MTIKTKLIFGYAVILAFVLAIAGSSYWAIRRWGGAAEELSSTYNSVLTAERLRANMTRQINFGRDFIYGDLAGAEEFREARNLSSDILNELKKNALNEDEMDHIKGLEVTHYELAWVIEGLLAKSPQLSSRPDAISARGRLREISDEVSDDIAALVQYYRAQEARSIGGAHRAGKIATAVIGSAGALAALLLVGLAFLLQRWLVYPIAVMNDTMRAISAGDLDAQAPIKSNDEWGHLASAVNKMSKALKASQQNLILQERLAALGEIASYTAHNLRNPLAGIRAATQVALCERRDTTQETTEALNEIIDSVDRMDTWIKRFLLYAKPLTLQLDNHDLNQIVDGVAAMASRPYAGKARVQTGLSDNLPEIQIDGVLIEQAIHVITANALESLDGEGGLVHIETAMRSGADGEAWAEIAVTDNGRGIPPNIQQRLFRPFTSSKEGGTGLGLAQAKKIIVMHGGAIEIESLSRGTRVSIRIPIRNIGGSAADNRER